MEFYYNTKSIKKGFFWRTLFIFFWMFIIWQRLRIYQKWSALLIAIEVGFTITYLVSAYRFFRLYRLEKIKVIKLTDEGISSGTKSEEVLIKWKDITNVEWTTLNKTDDFSFIVVKSQNQQIAIGEKIEDLKQIIQMLKLKVGDKFDTTEIPLELKLTS